jgi:hypothetical protein
MTPVFARGRFPCQKTAGMGVTITHAGLATTHPGERTQSRRALIVAQRPVRSN